MRIEHFLTDTQLEVLEYFDEHNAKAMKHRGVLVYENDITSNPELAEQFMAEVINDPYGEMYE